MEQAVCSGVVQVDVLPSGHFVPICTDSLGAPVPWTEVPYSSFWALELSTADVAEILGATLFVFAVVASVRFVYRTIVNR